MALRDGRPVGHLMGALPKNAGQRSKLDHRDPKPIARPKIGRLTLFTHAATRKPSAFFFSWPSWRRKRRGPSSLADISRPWIDIGGAAEKAPGLGPPKFSLRQPARRHPACCCKNRDRPPAPGSGPAGSISGQRRPKRWPRKLSRREVQDAEGAGRKAALGGGGLASPQTKLEKMGSRRGERGTRPRSCKGPLVQTTMKLEGTRSVRRFLGARPRERPATEC